MPRIIQLSRYYYSIGFLLNRGGGGWCNESTYSRRSLRNLALNLGSFRFVPPQAKSWRGTCAIRTTRYITVPDRDFPPVGYQFTVASPLN